MGDPSFSSQDRDRPTLSRAEFLPITPTAASLGATQQQQYWGDESSERYSGHCPGRGGASRPESSSRSFGVAASRPRFSTVEGSPLSDQVSGAGLNCLPLATEQSVSVDCLALSVLESMS